ncbi:MAG: hypothetical protein U1F30_02685 [Steroidobacteraceae bacterium]
MKPDSPTSVVEFLPRIGYLSNATYMEPWAAKIGQFIFNFGSIELVTHIYLARLEATEEEFSSSIAKLLQSRVDRIIDLLALNAGLPQWERDLAIRDWVEVKKMCVWRNHIAHNPVLPYWGLDKNPTVDPPEGITLPDIRQLRNGGGVHVTLETLSELVEVSVNLSQRLVETADAFKRSTPPGS